MFDEYGTGFLLIGGLVLWYFIGMLTNSISESKKPNGGVKKNKTKYSKKNRTPSKHIKEKRKPSTAYILFNYIMEWVSALINLFSGLISLPFVGPIIIFILILLVFVY
jgi:hypothetical protein